MSNPLNLFTVGASGESRPSFGEPKGHKPLGDIPIHSKTEHPDIPDARSPHICLTILLPGESV